MSKRDYKKEYAKYGKSPEAIAYRTDLNRRNRNKDNYGNTNTFMNWSRRGGGIVFGVRGKDTSGGRDTNHRKRGGGDHCKCLLNSERGGGEKS